MASKTISVTEEVYNLLKKMRLPRESFGDAIARLCKVKTSASLRLWAESSKGWSDLTAEETARLEDTFGMIRETLRPEGVDLI